MRAALPSASELSENIGDVLASIRRMIAQDGTAPDAGRPVGADAGPATVLRLDSAPSSPRAEALRWATEPARPMGSAADLLAQTQGLTMRATSAPSSPLRLDGAARIADPVQPAMVDTPTSATATMGPMPAAETSIGTPASASAVADVTPAEVLTATADAAVIAAATDQPGDTASATVATLLPDQPAPPTSPIGATFDSRQPTPPVMEQPMTAEAPALVQAMPAPAAAAAAPVLAPAPVAATPAPAVAAPVLAPAPAAAAPAPAPAPAEEDLGASIFSSMIREVIRQELSGGGSGQMTRDLRTMVLREVARAITGGDPATTAR